MTRRVYASEDPAMVNMLKHELESQGIECDLLGSKLAEIWLRDESQFGQALRVLQECLGRAELPHVEGNEEAQRSSFRKRVVATILLLAVAFLGITWLIWLFR